MPKSDPIRTQLTAQERIADEAHAALTAADDALALAEERARRVCCDTRRARDHTAAGRVAAIRERM